MTVPGIDIQKNGAMTMKKTILFAGIIGFATVLAASAAEPKENWANSCARCHGADGKGQTNMGKRLNCKDYTDASVQTALTDDAAFKAIKEGFQTSDGKTVMRPADEFVGRRHQGIGRLHADL